MSTLTMDRRTFLRGTGVAAGGLLLGFFLPLPGCSSPPLPLEPMLLRQGAVRTGPGDKDAWINAWIRIDAEGLTTLRLPSSEMGQGVLTALPMILAEELEADWSRVVVEMAPVHEAYYRPAYGSETMLTADSQSVRGYFDILRTAGAAARQMLIEAAARQWGVPAAECQARKGIVSHGSSGRQLSFGALATAASALPAPGKPALKARSAYTLIGTSPPRLDLLPKVNGTATFGMDVKVPGMLYAAVKSNPYFGGTLRKVDDSALKGMPGIIKRVDVPNAVAVIADNAGVSTSTLTATLRAGLDEPGRVLESKGNVEDAFQGAKQVLEATYEAPYLYHATMEPMNCTVQVQKDRCDIWVGTQAQDATRKAAVDITGLEPEQVHVHTTYLGGGFGRRGEVDFIEQALHIAKDAGRPVKMVWTREEDVTHDRYRPAFAARFKGAVGPDGLPVAWFNRNCGQNILEGRLPGAMMSVARGLQRVTGATVDILAVQGGIDLAYAIPHRKVEYVQRILPIPVGFWRSVGHSHNGFFVESFLDELAHAARVDPFEMRQRLLKDRPRELRVLEAAAKLGEWGSPASGHFQGIAFHDSFGTLVAQVAEVSVSPEGSLTVHRVSCAVDPGIIIHPDIVTAQIEGGIGYALSSMLRERIEIAGGRVVQSNFHDYQLMRMSQMPEVKVTLLETPDAPVGGIGEPGVPPLAPAVCNALFAATGVRIRSLPLLGQKLI